MKKIIQLTTPLERFQNFDKHLDGVLDTLDQCGLLYTDLGFRESDVEDLTKEQIEEFKDELRQHSQLIMSLLHHPLVQVLKEKRDTAESNETITQQLGYPEGVWQHYKGTRYRITGRVRLTDSRLDGINYQIDGKPDSQVYAISLINFYKKIQHNGSTIKRFTKVE